MIRRIFGAAAVIACVSVVAWWLNTRRSVAPEPPPAVTSREDHHWLDGLYSRNPREARDAEEEVTKRGAGALPEIQAVLRDPRSEADRLKGALKACAILGKTAAPAVDDVASVLAEEGLTTEAAIALSNMGPDAFAPLREGLRNRDPIVRRESLRSIGKLQDRGPLPTSRVTPLLIESMKDPDPGVRAVAATYLGIVQGAPEESVDALTAGLLDTNAEVRREAAVALAAFGAAARPALPALKKASSDPNEDVAREAARTMLKVQEK